MSTKLTNFILTAVIILSCAMLVYTINFVTTFDNQVQTTISAFSA